MANDTPISLSMPGSSRGITGGFTDGEFCHLLQEARSTVDRLTVLRQIILAKFGALASMASITLEDNRPARMESLVMISAARDAALDRLIPIVGTDGKA